MNNQMAASSSKALRPLLISIALGGMLVPLNSSMIALALPEIMKEFRAGASSAGWLVTAYLITMATLQLIAGKLGDQLGRRVWMIGGLIYFGFASLFSALAASLPTLLFLRVQQAIAGAIIVTNGLAIAFENVSIRQRASTMGSVNALVVLAAIGGPPLGGFLISISNWRAIFWVNIPLVLSALILGWFSIPPNRPNKDKQQFDLPGVILFVVSLILAVGLLSTYKSLNLLEVATGILLVLSAAMLFVCFEKRHPSPLLDLQLFKHRSFSSANAAIAFSNLSMYVILLALPILLSQRAGWSSMQTGFLLASMSAALAICSPLGGHLADRAGRRLPSIAGLVLMVFSMLPLFWAGLDVSATILFCCLILAGAGLGLAAPVLQTSAIEASQAHQTGVASGIASTSRYMGSILGASLLSGFLEASHSAENFRVVMLIVALSALCAALVSLGIESSVLHRISSVVKEV